VADVDLHYFVAVAEQLHFGRSVTGRRRRAAPPGRARRPGSFAIGFMPGLIVTKAVRALADRMAGGLDPEDPGVPGPISLMLLPAQLMA